jgi:hypothetical protein
MRVFWVTILYGCVGDAGSPTDTGEVDTGEIDTGTPGVCDPAETPLQWHCQSDLCNLCEDCDDEDEVLAQVTLCDPAMFVYGCCTQDTCTDPALGTFDRISCPEAYGTTYWWFDPTTRELAAYAWSTDYNGWCDGESFGQLFGPDLTGCQ